MGPRIGVDRSKPYWLRLECVARKKKKKPTAPRKSWISVGREREEEGAPG